MQDFLVDINKAQELGLLLRKSREIRNLTITSVSKKTKINIADLSRLETGQKLRINPFHLSKLCDLYGVPLIDVYLNLGYLDEKSLINYYSKFSSKEQEINDIIHKIPIFNLNSFEEEYYSTELSKEYIVLPFNEQKNINAIKIENDSMVPLFNKNNLVLFNFDDIKISNNDIGLFKINGTYSIGRYYLNDIFTIISYDNKNYSPVAANKKLGFMVIGKYKGHISI